MKKKFSSIFALVLAMTMVLTACGDGNSEPTGDEENKSTGGIDAETLLSTVPNYNNPQGTFAKGPNGEDAVAADTIELTDEQYAQLQTKGLKAALLWAGASEWYNAMTDGAKAEFEKMGVEVVATSDAGFDPATQATQIETSLALNPDFILSLPVDPESGTAAFQPAGCCSHQH